MGLLNSLVKEAVEGVSVKKLMKILSLQRVNSGACVGPDHWSTTKDKGTIISFNPSTRAEIAEVYNASQEDFEHVIASATKASEKWRHMPAPKRGELVRDIGELLREHKDALGSLVSLEMGKIKQEGDGEVQEMIDMADLAVGQSRMLYGKTIPSERECHSMYEQWHPLGVLGVITAFNFPVAVWAWNAFLALITGNAVIWRPSPKTPLTAIAVQQLCNQVLAKYDCEGLISLLITDDVALAQSFVCDPRVHLVSFTGSSRVGKHIHQLVAERHGKCLLEMSGNNAVIVDETADLRLAIPSIVFGAVGTAGQRCTSTRRLIVHVSLLDEVLDALLHAYHSIEIGNPLHPNTLMGPLIDQLAVDNYLSTIKKIKALGGKVLYGGKVLDAPGFFVMPTIVLAKQEWDIVKEETFAPILYVMGYGSLDEAIKINNNVPQGLSSSLFTQNVKHAHQFLSHMGSDCGIANINIGTSGAEIGGAFGGEKETGGGREAGSDAWKSYMRRQTNTVNWGDTLPLAQGIKFGVNDE